MKYLGRWSTYEEMLKEFQGYEGTELKGLVPTKSEVLFSSYGGGAYEGDATVIFRKKGKLYEVNGSHCSCYGLGDQWVPEETTVEALAKRGKKSDEEYGYWYLHDHDDPAYDEYWKLVARLQKSAKTKKKK